MTELGFEEIANADVGAHPPTLPFDLGGIHYQGNVLGNWYHIVFSTNGIPGSSVWLQEFHYEINRPWSTEHFNDFRNGRHFKDRRTSCQWGRKNQQ